MRNRVAVIGAGIIGLSCALELLDRGWAVTLFDRVGPAGGTSPRANGALTPYSDHSVPDLVSEMAEESIGRYPSVLDRIREESGLPVDHDVDGVLEVMISGEEVKEGEASFEQMKAKGWDVQWLDAADVLNLEPVVSQGVSAGIFYANESRIDVDQLLTALCRTVTLHGCTLSYPATVVSVTTRGDDVVEVATTTGSALFDSAVVCTGTEVCRVGDLPAVALTRVRGELIEAWGPPGLIGRCVYRGDGFLTPRRDGRILLGTSYDVQTPEMDQDSGTISLGTALQTLQANCETIPALRVAQLRRVWKGWRSFTSDGLPALGRYGGPNIVLALGFGGLGFTLASSAAPIVAELVGGQSQDERLTMLDPMRQGLERL